MSKIDYQALREIAKLATQGEWVAFISPGTGTYAVHTPGDKRCEDVIKWTGFDGQKNAENNARYIAAFNPETVLALLDELEAAEKRNAELESGSQAQKLVEAIIVAIENEQERLFDEDYLMDSKECIDVIREEVKRWNDSRAAGIRIKGE
ncbi:ead/Ea22-like family protein [Escherichia coli]